MNCLIIFPQELIGPTQARLTNQRAKHAIEVHDLKAGIKIFAGEFGGKLGQAKVISVSPEIVELTTDFVLEPPIRVPVDLIVAVPRPQTVKKVIGIATTMGIRSIHFLKSANTVKSYLQSPTILSENIANEVLKGLEQACDSIGPAVHVHARVHEFFDNHLPNLLSQNPARFILDTCSSTTNGADPWRIQRGTQPVIGAIGPESGWAQNEIERFEQLGFVSVSLGPRMLRVETAVTSFLSRIELLRGQHGNI